MYFRDHPYNTSALFWTFSDPPTFYVSISKYSTKRQQKWPFSKPTHTMSDVPLLNTTVMSLYSKYVKNCNIFGQILNIWVKLILKKNFNFFFQCLALPKDSQSFGILITMLYKPINIILGLNVEASLIIWG